MDSSTTLETVLKRDRAIVLAGLAGVTILCWIYLVWMAGAMESMPATMSETVALTQLKPWTAMHFTMMFIMWVLMMIGMMVPTASPMVLVFARFSRQRREQDHPAAPAGAFLGGYLAVWTLFSLAATTLQWGLERAALLSPMMVSTSPALGGGILIVAGVFQLTPYKTACLHHCRSPLEFFMKSWRPGAGGAFRMGFHHGAYCTGCCWILMCILFVGGVMSLLWIGAITVFVLAEKVVPFGAALARVTGAMLIAAGVLVMYLG